jgi:serine/threonine-protein kinase
VDVVATPRIFTATMADTIHRLNEALAGRYRVQRQLGEGGMATVYLADDLRHERKVAVKVLKPELAAVVGADRFLVEIKTTANLQHPNILPLFDSGNAGSFLFYVMPYVEGETLRDRLDREHQLPVEDAVHIISDVAEALDYAHRHGVIHRDIKPANILLREGKPLIADFGIALALGVAGEGRMTETGLSLGTPHYMSPEQATGDRGVGAATDIYAVGCVLFEMLVGDPPYTGSSAQAIVGKIIAGEFTPATKQRPSIPANVDATISRALEKLPADRFRTAQEFAKALTDPGFRHGAAHAVGSHSSAGPWKAATTALGVLAVLLGSGLVWSLRRAETPPMVARFEAPFREGQGPLEQRSESFSLSLDGRLVVYKGENQNQTGRSQLWVRRWSDADAKPIRGTEAAGPISLSPDGQHVAYTQAGEIRVTPIDGGVPRVVAAGRSPYWGPDGNIYYTGSDQALRRMPEAGDGSVLVRSPADNETGQVLTDVLPGGTHALVVLSRDTEPYVMSVVDLRSGDMKVLGPGDRPRYAATGHLTWIAADGSLTAARFDRRTMVVGAPVTMAANVVGYSLSQTGTLAYTVSTLGDSLPTNLVLVSRDGTRSKLAELSGTGWTPRFSPDGRRVAIGISPDLALNSGSDLWTLELARGALTRVTFGGNNRFNPIWTRDGSHLTHADGSSSENRLLATAADGTGGSRTLVDRSQRKFPTSWSPDGRFLAYYVGPQGTPTNSRDIWMLEVTGDSVKAAPFVQTPFMERGAIFSPDGKWLAYVSDKAGSNGVYARPFPGPGAEVTISVGGGSEPVWGSSGRELFYRHDGSMMVVRIDTTGSTLTVGSPRGLFDDPYMRDIAGSAGGVANYDISPAGERFVMVESPAASAGAAPINMVVVLNWFEELRSRVP